ncbi:peptidyl-prolyl cis-trans isomerase [Sporosarcina sp. FSL K6-3457]|uniref:peptidyl-prolyl cis-trans isomerase n=1 Tax=Sporosarcina sp. FSL K6-3457 TaxID=2978204 RepID=UPI0030F6716F
MEAIIPIKGNVRYAITLDPGVWIFDDRRIDLKTYFTENHIEKDELEQYKKEMGAHWSREIMEGATFPPTLKTEKTFEKTKVVTGTYGILFSHFLKTAEPAADATTISFELADGTVHSFPIEQAEEFIFKFSEDGKPLIDDGLIHVLLKDGSTNDTPIRDVTTIRID